MTDSTVTRNARHAVQSDGAAVTTIERIAAIDGALSANLCRCTDYQGIIATGRAAAMAAT